MAIAQGHVVEQMRGYRVEQRGLLRSVTEARQPDVRGLEIEMEDAGAVDRSQPFGDLRAQLERPRGAHPAVLPQLVGQGELPSALVDEEERLHQVDAGPERPRDVGVVQIRDRGQSLGFGEEPLDGLGIRRVPAQQLQHHGVAAGVFSQPGMREPAGAQLVQKPETGDLHLL